MEYAIVLAAKSEEDEAVYNTQMRPVRGKPALAWVVESITSEKNIIVVLNKNNTKAQDFLSKKYPFVMIKLVDFAKEMENYNNISILNSLNRGLEAIQEDVSNSKVSIVLGDTLCKYDNSEKIKDLIVVSSDYTESSRWCLVESDLDNNAVKFCDKEQNVPKDKKALVGYYQFSDISLLKSLTVELLRNKKTQISDLLYLYMKSHPIACVNALEWFDLGHKSGVIKAQNHFFNSRGFNSLIADPILGTITKSSSKKQKLADEYEWYLNLPNELKVLSPRIVSFEEKAEQSFLTMEMYGYPALSELYILSRLSIEEWELIIRRLFDVHKLFEKYTTEMDQENFYDLYLHKTWQRLKEQQEQDPYWKKLWKYEYLVINGKKYKNIRFFEMELNNKIEQLVDSVKVTIMHGDYCFSNILFDMNSFLCRVIDPRGRMREQTIYGDSRYDIAKLRHSVVGGYDYAVHGLFSLREDENTFEITNNYPSFQDKITSFFDKTVVDYGYDLKEIKLIEALLFASMIPLHKDNMERQKVFYLKAVKKINELFER